MTHTLDGAITTFTSPLVLTILDRNGNPFTLGVTIGTVTADPQGQGAFYSDVRLTQSVPANDYILQWAATYTPKAGVPALPILQRVSFKVNSTEAPSQYFFKDTREM